MTALDRQPHSLYRCYGADGALLASGVGVRPATRRRRRAALAAVVSALGESSEWGNVERATVERYPSKAAAEQAAATGSV